MRMKCGCFSAVRRALLPNPKEKKDQKSSKPKSRWFGKRKNWAPVSSAEETVFAIHAPLPPIEDVKLSEAENEQNKHDVKLAEAENEQIKHAHSVAIATSVAAEAAVAAAQAAAEVVRLTTVPCYSGKSKEEIAAIKIQTAFRGYFARRALRALRGLVRLKSLMQGQSVKQQAASTLRCMQTLARVQSQIRARRIRMSEENQALQRQLQHKREKELEKLTVSTPGEDWNDSTQSKEQVEAKLLNRQEAAIRRERALAYAFSHQKMLKNTSKSATPTFMDPNNPHWGWSWLERWMAARPWESRSAIDHSERASVKSAASRAVSVGEITKSYSRRDLYYDNKPSPTGQKSSRPQSRQSPSTPASKAPSSSSVTGRRKIQSSGGSGLSVDDDSTSMVSVQSDRCRRHSFAGSSVIDDESLASLPSVPSYMAPTRSTRIRSRLASPLGLEKHGTPEKGSAGSVKKRLSFPASPARSRRHSSPANVDTSSIKDTEVHMEDNVFTGVMEEIVSLGSRSANEED